LRRPVVAIRRHQRIAPRARIQASKFSNVPPKPLLARRNSAVPPVCRANAELSGIPEEEPFEVLVEAAPADEEAVEEFEELEELEELEGRPELPVLDCSALCTTADSSVLTRFKAVWLAMLDRPSDKLVMAWPMLDIKEALAARLRDTCRERLQ
jgi:hypothetical protein